VRTNSALHQPRKQRLGRSSGDYYVIPVLGQNDIAWEEETYTRLDPDRRVRELWIAGAENDVRVDLNAELFLECLLNVDFRQHSEALDRECRRNTRAAEVSIFDNRLVIP
jgi:hypothetical protein